MKWPPFLLIGKQINAADDAASLNCSSRVMWCTLILPNPEAPVLPKKWGSKNSVKTPSIPNFYAPPFSQVPDGTSLIFSDLLCQKALSGKPKLRQKKLFGENFGKLKPQIRKNWSGPNYAYLEHAVHVIVLSLIHI